MDKTKIVVVGAGPAGMMAAIRASELGKEVALIEKNSAAGKKLLLSGKGRCNLTNSCDSDDFIKRFSRNGQFLRDAFKKFFNRDLMRFFESRGLKLNVERQLRVFPASNKSGSILEVLLSELRKNKVNILYGRPVRDIITRDKQVKGFLFPGGEVIPSQRVILATGGVSYGFTGSTGEGLKIAAALGHRIISPKPGLVPLETRQRYPRALEGLVLKNIVLKFGDFTKKIISPVGELLFTAFGISGPLVLTLSGRISEWLLEKKSVFVEIDLKPALTTEQLNARLLRELKSNSRKTFKNVLKNLLPNRLTEVFVEILNIPADKQASQITRVERQRIVSLLKGWRLDILKTRPIEEAMVTRGGVSLKDINSRTMESRIVKGLYFAGEMIDVDADTGGFNLQAAFSTGYLAGESAASN